MYYDDYFDEPSEFEEQIEEFKDSLAKAVKKEHQEEIERLRKENLELQDIKARMKQIKLEHAEALRQLKATEDRAIYEAKRARLNELLPENFIQGWGVENNGEKLPKCDKCDDRRRIHYKTPLGKDACEDCDCDKRETKYEPTPVECFRFTQNKHTYGGDSYPRTHKYFTRRSDQDYDEYDKTTNIYDGKPFDKVNKYGIVFLDKDECKKYCDWLNEKSKED